MANTTITPLVGVISLSNFLVRDDFNRANENPLTTSKWTTATAQVAWKLVSNTAQPTGTAGTDNGSYDAQLAAANWPTIQYAQANLTVTSTGGAAQGVGLKVRQSTSAQTYYRLVADHAASNNVIVQKFVAGVLTAVVAAFTKAWTDGALWRIEIVGSTVRVFLNNLQIGQGTDATITTGVPGIEVSTNITSASLDNWEAGTLCVPLVTQQTNTARVPVVGVITLTGFAPVVTQGGATNTGITPSVGAISITGGAAGVLNAVGIVPGAGALNLSATVASVVQGIGRIPQAGQLAVSGASPTLAFGNVITPAAGFMALAGGQAQVQRADSIAPNPGALTLTGFAPTTGAAVAITPGTGALAVIGIPITLLANTLRVPGAGSVSLGGASPLVFSGTNIAPGSGAAIVAGQPPTLAQAQTITPQSGTVTLAGLAPVVGSAGAVTPQAGALALVGYAPVVAASVGITPGSGSVGLTGNAPALSNTAAIGPNSGAVAFTGFAPVLRTATTVAPPSGAVNLSGNAPVVGTSGVNSTIRPNTGAIALTGQRVHLPASGPHIQDGQGGDLEPYKYVEPYDWHTPLMQKQIAHLRTKQYLGVLQDEEELELLHLTMVLDEVT